MSFGYQVLGFGSGGIGFTYIVATGGDSIATDGDYKVHTFTSPGTFAVSATGGDTTPTTYRDKISYMVVGGGGGSGGWNGAEAGGGGAGGFRANDAAAGGGFSPVSPLANPVGTFTVSTSPGSYPITVGSGGTAVSGASIVGNDGGSSSGFSITSAGGGGGGSGANPSGNPGRAGGSGGGGGGQAGGSRPGGAGNTPPVSPPQGNAGGPGAPPVGSGGTGGGAGGVGAHSWPRPSNYNPTPHGITGADTDYSSGGPSGTMGGQPGAGKSAGLAGGVLVRYRFQGNPT